MTVTIYHNPRCSKSRQTLNLLKERGLEPEVIEYLKAPPEPSELKRIIAMLGITAHELLRRGEKEYRELGLGPDHDEDELIQAMIRHPRLIERPIVIAGAQARLGRPPENVMDILP